MPPENLRSSHRACNGRPDESGQADGLISTGKLTPYGAYTPGLSRRSLRRASWGFLVLEEVSRLDAFSVYPFRT